ncbi:hypothetical protein [endosymbiont GvMRE of Glomus versiforme]|uniref:hypothetical protein n=1 Tax=endosymbiont GvMRE of Glomus versiforme TaxID=2039283 RepID=UPI00155868D7|nr:hypothetical protein [endosymbiont GvMRE of Glomus versiforme]
MNNLERGCVRIYEDNWKNCYVGWLDIDEKGWTKIAKQLRNVFIRVLEEHRFF